jgi:hypothetical protein
VLDGVVCSIRFRWAVSGSIRIVGGGSSSSSGILISLNSQTDERCLSGWHSGRQARPSRSYFVFSGGMCGVLPLPVAEMM